MTFEIIYDGNTYTGDFVEGKPIWFHNSEQGRGAPPVDNKIISYVRLSIAETGQKPINHRIPQYTYEQKKLSSKIG